MIKITIMIIIKNDNDNNNDDNSDDYNDIFMV